MTTAFPLGKLPPAFLANLLAQAPQLDPRILLGPGAGLDCAVIDLGERLLVLKSDPITFAIDQIGWYAVQINANDIATSGAEPRWMMVTLLLPEGKTTPGLVEDIFDQVYRAAAELGISVIGGHSEVTYGLDRPILSATLIGETTRERLVTPRGAQPGDRLLLTKGVPVEGTAILAREFPARLEQALTAAELEEARSYLTHPGISVTRDAALAQAAGKVTAMHDPTEGGLAGALWELADASGRRLVMDPARVPVPELAAKICRCLGLDPLATIASGALLLAAAAQHAAAIQAALESSGIPCADIGRVEAGEAGVWNEKTGKPLDRPARDEIARLFEMS
ncbi:MAG: AIR synthase family protein [Anaerolineaceae bacterium]|nr:AIR synthase family protein [Anaerolineaceae bacterium]